jgi:hypothetical protein
MVIDKDNTNQKNADSPELIIEAGRTEKHYWQDLWRYRELFYFLAWRDILVRYKQTAIGLYSINAFVLSDVTNIELRVDEVISFTVHDTGAMRKEYGGGWIGVVRPKLAWQTEYLTPLNENTNVLTEKL